MSGPLPPSLAPVTAPLSLLYGVGVGARNLSFRLGRPARRLALPVISVGNLSAGGVGKTPVVQWIGRALLEAGHRPVVAMRGYGATADGASDEAMEHAEVLAGVPVVADPRRHAALKAWLPDHPETDCVILDDGFQHRQLARDLDLVLLDATRNALGDRLLPAGWLREPPRALRRADAVMITHAEDVDPELAARVEAVHGEPPVAWSRHVWRAVEVLEHGTSRREPTAWLEGRKVIALFGVGQPEAAVRMLLATGARIVNRLAARDHAAYDRSILHRLAFEGKGADAIVMTRKDWVKVRLLLAENVRDPASVLPVPVVVPDLAIEVHAGDDALRRRVLACVRRDGPAAAAADEDAAPRAQPAFHDEPSLMPARSPDETP